MDTGASFCIFQRRHAETVGIVVESGARTSISTVTGGFVAYAHQVALGVLGIVVDVTVYFAEDPAMSRDVLGQTGWLDRMRLGLADHDRQLYLSHYDDAAEEWFALTRVRIMAVFGQTPETARAFSHRRMSLN